MAFQLTELYASLTARDVSYNAALDQARIKAEATQGVMSQLGIASALTWAGIGAGAVLGSRYVIRAAMQQEDALHSLSSALAVHGEEVENNTARLAEAAAGIQAVTVYGDEQTESLMTQARILGVTSGALEEAAQKAIGLATALRMDVQSALRYVLMAEAGHFTMLERQVPAMRAAKTEAEKLAVVQNLIAAGWQQAQRQTETAGGAMKQTANAVGDAAEAIGGLLTPIVTVAAGGVKLFANFIELSVGGLRAMADAAAAAAFGVDRLAAAQLRQRAGGATPEYITTFLAERAAGQAQTLRQLTDLMNEYGRQSELALTGHDPEWRQRIEIQHRYQAELKKINDLVADFARRYGAATNEVNRWANQAREAARGVRDEQLESLAVELRAAKKRREEAEAERLREEEKRDAETRRRLERSLPGMERQAQIDLLRGLGRTREAGLAEVDNWLEDNRVRLWQWVEQFTAASGQLTAAQQAQLGRISAALQRTAAYRRAVLEAETEITPGKETFEGRIITPSERRFAISGLEQYLSGLQESMRPAQRTAERHAQTAQEQLAELKSHTKLLKETRAVTGA